MGFVANYVGFLSVQKC